MLAPRLVIDWVAATSLWAAAAAGVAAPALKRADVPAGAVGTTVDVELVLAVDISYSMDPEEQALQREGYVAALTSPKFLNALRQGLHGKIVAAYVEWAGAAEQRVVVPWQVIDGRGSAEAFANAIADAPYRLPHLDLRRAAVRRPTAWSTCRGTAPTIKARWSRSRATSCSPRASPSTACRSCSSAHRPRPWISTVSTSTTRIA